MGDLTNINRQIGRNRLFPNVLTGRNGASQMPQGGRLSQCEIDQITAWVNQGAKNN
jgi:mono/diheme cytochrome c family protein